MAYELITKTLGKDAQSMTYEEAAELLVAAKEKAAKIARKLAVAEQLVDELKLWFLDKFEDDGVSGVKVAAAGVQLARLERDVFDVTDWDRFGQWILQQADIGYLQKRPSVTAIQEFRRETGKLPPGIVHGTRVDLSIRTLRNGK
jgi:hypothetical protein